MSVKSFIGGMVVGGLLVSMIPYSVEKDEDTGAIEIRSFLWGCRKTPNEEDEDKYTFAFAIPPSGIDAE